MSPLRIGLTDKSLLHPGNVVEDKRASALKLAHQFEELFVQQMVGSLRQASQIGGEESGMFGSGPGSDTYAQWFDQNLAQQVARGGNLGIADLLMRDFERNGEIPKAPKAMPKGPTVVHPADAAAAVRQGVVDVDA
jgi:Rod binding domain-containing protein